MPEILSGFFYSNKFDKVINMQKEIEWLLKEKYNSKSEAKEYPNFKKDIKRLDDGEPLDYVIGFREFLGCRIDLSKKPLIPRPETEYWVSKAIENIKKGRALDIFSGSGCIGVAILKHSKIPLCDISDKDKNALSQIRINCKLNKINPERYKIIESDIFSSIKGKYDFVFANPPYISVSRKKSVQKSVLEFEPRAALFGGKDGLFYINRFLRDAKEHLVIGGKIFMEFDPSQKTAIAKLVKKYNYKSCEFHKDQYNRWRWVVIRC